MYVVCSMVVHHIWNQFSNHNNIFRRIDGWDRKWGWEIKNIFWLLDNIVINYNVLSKLEPLIVFQTVSVGRNSDEYVQVEDLEWNKYVCEYVCVCVIVLDIS